MIEKSIIDVERIIGIEEDLWAWEKKREGKKVVMEKNLVRN